MSETSFPTPEELHLTEFHIRKGERLGSHLMGLQLHNAKGVGRFVVTREQLLYIAEACQKAAESMPKPS
jgi:hypothetical protein